MDREVREGDTGGQRGEGGGQRRVDSRAGSRSVMR